LGVALFISNALLDVSWGMAYVPPSAKLAFINVQNPRFSALEPKPFSFGRFFGFVPDFLFTGSAA
jgi:hypothetical protein